MEIAHNGHGPKIGGGLCPFWGGGAGSPSNTMPPGPLHAKFHFDPSNHLVTIHQHHRQTDRQTDRQDNGPIA